MMFTSILQAIAAYLMQHKIVLELLVLDPPKPGRLDSESTKP